jgi:DNA mismatch repair protein MutS
VRPQLSEDSLLEIDAGRHPVVEQVVAAGRFVPNDTRLDTSDNQIHILTGPNMSGKSTYLRQVGLLVLLAQCGSFVPAARARVGLVDRIFTRVGASDQLALGRSTFLVEMEETANILHHCTDRSLVLLDEIGRGTSTYDGLAIAWAVCEHLHETEGRRARTLFATHYHELTALATRYPRIRNYQVVVKRHGGRVLFLHEIREGGCDDSYGIEVARLAGLPASVTARAKEILLELEAGQFHPERSLRTTAQRSLFTPPVDPLLSELALLSAETLTPIEALNRLSEFIQEARLRSERE